MAFFNEADARLSPLTQFYQIKGYDEMYKLAVRFTDGYVMDRLLPYELVSDEELINSLLNVQKTVKKIMDALADDGEIDAGTAYRFTGHIKAQNVWHAMIMQDKPAGPGEPLPYKETMDLELPRREKIKARMLDIRKQATHPLELAVLEILGGLLKPDQLSIPLSRCPECRSVYHIAFPSRRSAAYCSHRCANRVAQRERVREKRKGGAAKIVDE